MVGMFMITTLEEAKEQSLRKWRKILDDYPRIIVTNRGSSQPCGLTYEHCGFCELYGYNCVYCPLFPKVCINLGLPGELSLYWRIVRKLGTDDNRGLKQMIQKMIREIERVDTSSEI